MNDQPDLDDENAWLDRITSSTDYSQFHLGMWRIVRDGDLRTHALDPRTALSRSDFERYYNAMTPYRRLTERRTFQLFRRAHSRLVDAVDLQARLSRAGGRRDESLDGHSTALGITGVFTDWLSWSYIYLDNEETFWTALGAEEVQIFKEATNAAFDQYPAYRFLYQLRNFAQHYGPPLAYLSVSSEREQVVEVVIRKRQLTDNSFHWNRHSQAVLATLDEEFSVIPLVDQAMMGYEYIEKQLLNIYLKYAASWIDVLEEMLDLCDGEDGIPTLMAIPSDPNFSMQTIGSIGLHPILSSDGLRKFKSALDSDDPAERFLVPPTRIEEVAPGNLRELRAAEVMGEFFANDGDAAMGRIDQILLRDGTPLPLIRGLVEQVAISTYLLSQLTGRPIESFLRGTWTGRVVSGRRRRLTIANLFPWLNRRGRRHGRRCGS